MSSHSYVLHSDSAAEFCDALKALRERQGIKLDAIADATKIPVYLFEGLEHNDLRRWPKGLFRRSFFRDYAKAIGLPVSEACAAFVRLFPDHSVATDAEPETAPAMPTAQAPKAQALSQAVDAVTTVWRRVAGEFRHLMQRFKVEPAPEPPEPARKWVSDARRVGPGQPRIRVRIKVPR